MTNRTRRLCVAALAGLLVTLAGVACGGGAQVEHRPPPPEGMPGVPPGGVQEGRDAPAAPERQTRLDPNTLQLRIAAEGAPHDPETVVTLRAVGQADVRLASADGLKAELTPALVRARQAWEASPPPGAAPGDGLQVVLEASPEVAYSRVEEALEACVEADLPEVVLFAPAPID